MGCSSDTDAFQYNPYGYDNSRKYDVGLGPAIYGAFYALPMTGQLGRMHFIHQKFCPNFSRSYPVFFILNNIFLKNDRKTERRFVIMKAQRKIAKIYTKVKLREQKSDFEYWQSQSIEKRLKTLEQIRNEYHFWKDDTQPGFQRVLSIIKRK